MPEEKNKMPNQISVTKHSESHYTIQYDFGKESGVIEQISGEESKSSQEGFYDRAERGEITEISVVPKTDNTEETRMRLKKELGYKVLKLLHQFGPAEVKTNFGRYWR